MLLLKSLNKSNYEMPAIINSAFYEVVMSDIEKKLQKRLFRFFFPEEIAKS